MRRRRFLQAAAFGMGAALVYPFGLRAKAAAGLPAPHVAKLESSPYVYISPLLASGQESTCHAEVWYGWIDGAVVVTVASDRWKARAIEKGLDTARIWVGDYGRWKKLGIPTSSYREGPVFDGRGEISRDAELLERLLEAYDLKYPEEIGQWRDKMRAGLANGSRVLIRYRPVS